MADRRALLCENRGLATDAIRIRRAEESDRTALAMLLAAVAEERDGIATEPPIDIDEWAEKWGIDGTLVAVATGEIVGEVRIGASRFGFGELGMMVAADWRGRAWEQHWLPPRSTGRKPTPCTS